MIHQVFPCRPGRATIALALAAAFASGAQAESEAGPRSLSKDFAEPPRASATCEPGDLMMAGAPMFRVAGRGRLHMLEMGERCQNARCGRALAPYITRADTVFGGPEQRGVRCVEYGTPQGALRAGFVPAANLAPVSPERALTEPFLRGVWRDGENSIRVIAARPRNQVSIEGTALYRGTGTPNEGQFSANVTLAGSEEPLVLRDGGCIVVLERRGPYLLANDNARCGGHNVRFVGIYVKRAAR